MHALCSVLLGSVLGACFQPEVPADRFGDESVGLPTEPFATDSESESESETGELPGCEFAGSSALVRMRFGVRTSAPGGQFAPRNVGAIWIEDGAGNFVRTLERWGITRAKWLELFNASSNENVVDAITGPTLTSHQLHMVEWDLHDLDDCEVQNGEYAVLIELTDRSGAGEWLRIAFDKGMGGATIEPADAPTFHEMVLVIE